MRLLLILFTLFAILPASATITMNSIIGFSRIQNFNPGSTTENTAITIFGGLAGDPNGADGEVSNNTITERSCSLKPSLTPTTCNNCQEYGKPCNRTRVYSGSVIRFQFVSTTEGIPTIFFDVPNDDNDINIATTNLTVPANSTTTIDLPWNEVCQRLRKDGLSCDDPLAATDTSGNALDFNDLSDKLQGTFRIGIVGSENDLLDFSIELQMSIGDIDTVAGEVNLNPHDSKNIARNGTHLTDTNDSTGQCDSRAGVCEFALFPGDGKAFIDNVVIRSISNGQPIHSAVFFCADAGTPVFTAYNLCSDPIRVINSQLQENIIEGLANDQTLLVRSAVEDFAGNIGFFSDLGDDTNCPPGAAFDPGCHEVTPSEVAGLFEDEFNCFVATAAFGSPIHNQVAFLRKFRGKFLMQFALGRRFVRWYYQTSPPWADWISKSPVRKGLAQILLLPLIGIAYAILYWPISLSLLALGLMVVFYRRNRRQGAMT